MRGKGMRYGLAALCAILAAGLLASAALSKEGKKMDALRISSPAFESNGSIPTKYTCDGMDVNPPLRIGNVPPGTRSLALIVDDPDAPKGTWVHWVVWNIDPKTSEIGEDTAPKDALQAINDFGKHEYGGPCPPSGTHRYFFKLYALDAMLSFSAEAGKAGLEKAMEGHIMARAEMVGLYKRRR